MNKGKRWWESTASTSVKCWCKIWWMSVLSGIAAGGTGVNITPPLVERFLTTGGGGGGVISFLHQFLPLLEGVMRLTKNQILNSFN
ncbi:hypothetical protein M0K47_000890 [Escherichia coli]|uniref:hypothetical protein n=1 Tax=Escherichia coli TaxID=562 RepID=UPI001067E7F2|nr:hypothetical protein [Escherichia coli]EEY6114758.1 hypothetical protein [Escherichia coli]EHK6603873.1 hypothetical protein [Escherichia coli]EKX8148033.1 hypothetical protein [Escherichia coli]EMD7206444.1 hypothetical protein [Escherichia coli]MCG4664972.1 hypothetical protein [Escherichia coli]